MKFNLILVSIETTTATKSNNVTFMHCPKLKGGYTCTGPSEILEFISSHAFTAM